MGMAPMWNIGLNAYSFTSLYFEKVDNLVEYLTENTGKRLSSLGIPAKQKAWFNWSHTVLPNLKSSVQPNFDKDE